MRRRWKRFRYAMEWAGLVSAGKLIPLLPRRCCVLLAHLLGWLMSLFDRQGRKVALANLEAAFGDELTESQRYRILRESFQHFARTMVDLLWSPRLTRENFQRYVELENFQETGRGTGPERSIIIACFHYGNFEWLSLVCGFLGLPGTIIAQQFKNARLDPIFRKLREQSGHELIPRDRGIVRLYKVLRRKGRTALLVDLTVPPRQGAVVVDCFGLKTSLTSAHAWLHQQTGAAIIPAHCQPLPNGRYRLVFHPRVAHTEQLSLRQIAQACWDSFEPYARKNPGPWLWMYKHWRYRPMNPDRPYPFYAQTWKAFERMLSEE
jgi:Kdo2-lipid IVA lauroyltransferase/acyltransferase